jgi:CRISPR-associated endonuclease/helicase Cas3
VARVLARERGNDALRALVLIDVAPDVLEKVLVRAAFLHDLGKANSAFQDMLRRQLAGPQPFRHEILSCWLIHRHRSIADWIFSGCPPWTSEFVTAAVLGHHLSFTELVISLSPAKGSGLMSMDCYWSHPDFHAALTDFARAESLSEPPCLVPDQLNLAADPLAAYRRELCQTATELEDLDPAHRTLLALLKSFLIAADVAGSALPRSGRDPAWWASEALARRCEPADYEAIAASGPKGGEYRPFQTELSESTARVTFVRAGCGNGKTTAAYLWASRQPTARRLYICYPTTGTATEGFRDYVVDNIPPAQSALLHGRSAIDLEVLFTNRDLDPLEDIQRATALECWDAPLVVCTVDRVLVLLR